MEHTPGLETSPPGSDTLEVAGGPQAHAGRGAGRVPLGVSLREPTPRRTLSADAQPSRWVSAAYIAVVAPSHPTGRPHRRADRRALRPLTAPKDDAV